MQFTYVFYLVPVLLGIAVLFGFSFYMRNLQLKRVQSMSPEEASRRFNEFFSQYFELSPGETLVGIWSGVEFQGAQSAARQVAGNVANYVSAQAIGISTYIPMVWIGQTSHGRVLVSREYSDFGARGNFKQLMSFQQGARALPAHVARQGQELGAPPKLPTQPNVGLEFVQLRGASGEFYEAWMSPQGNRVGQTAYCSILQALG
ncbi:MAG TPA: hypothetical protein VFQ61_35870 [Polyangiaceae bacterium]|nr:hypothetical protein [Polyangiaceae bacterium]